MKIKIPQPSKGEKPPVPMQVAVDPVEDAVKGLRPPFDVFESVAYFSLSPACGKREKFVSGRNMIIYLNKRFSSLRI